MNKPKIYDDFYEELERRVAEAVHAIEEAQVGEVFAWPANSREPHRGLLCNGAAVSRTTYAKLFETIGTAYGAGDGSTTFNLPNLTDRFIQGSGTAGTVKAAGLPEIAGYFNAFPAANGGAFRGSAQYSGTRGKDFGTHEQINFYASLSNSTYGASDTVQPPALTMRYYIKY